MWISFRALRPYEQVVDAVTKPSSTVGCVRATVFLRSVCSAANSFEIRSDSTPVGAKRPAFIKGEKTNPSRTRSRKVVVEAQRLGLRCHRLFIRSNSPSASGELPLSAERGQRLGGRPAPKRASIRGTGRISTELPIPSRSAPDLPANKRSMVKPRLSATREF